jgi:hypothetical protein
MVVHKPRFEALYAKELQRREDALVAQHRINASSSTPLVDSYSKSLSGTARITKQVFHEELVGASDSIPPTPHVPFAEIVFKEVMRCHCGLDSIADQTLSDLKAASHKFAAICPTNAIIDYFLGCDDSDVLDQMLLFADTRNSGIKFTRQEVQKVKCQDDSVHILERRYIPVKDIPPCVQKMVEGCADAVAARVRISVAEWVTEEMPFGGLAFDLADNVDYVELTRAVVAERLGKWSTEAVGCEGSHHESLLSGEGHRAPLDNGYASVRSATAAQLADRMQQAQDQSVVGNTHNTSTMSIKSPSRGPLSPAAISAAASLLNQAGRSSMADSLQKWGKEQSTHHQHHATPTGRSLHLHQDYGHGSPVSEPRRQQLQHQLPSSDDTSLSPSGRLNNGPRVATEENSQLSPIRGVRGGGGLRRSYDPADHPTALSILATSRDTSDNRNHPTIASPRRYSTSPNARASISASPTKITATRKVHVTEAASHTNYVDSHDDERRAGSNPYNLVALSLNTSAATTTDHGRQHHQSQSHNALISTSKTNQASSPASIYNSPPKNKKSVQLPTQSSSGSPTRKSDAALPDRIRNQQPSTSLHQHQYYDVSSPAADTQYERRRQLHSPTNASMLREACTVAKLREMDGRQSMAAPVPTSPRRSVSRSTTASPTRAGGSGGVAISSPIRQYHQQQSSPSPSRFSPTRGHNATNLEKLPHNRRAQDPPIERDFCPPTRLSGADAADTTSQRRQPIPVSSSNRVSSPPRHTDPT